MKTASILIVEDETALASILSDYLQQSGFETHRLTNGNEVIDAVKQHMPSLLLLDLMLPGKDGLTICRELRTFSDIPIIIVTARVEEIDRLLGLELGADDYVCKPYSPREVVARIKAILRRIDRPAASRHIIELDSARYRVRVRGEDVDLTAVEFQLLQTLAAEPGRIFSRTQLMDAIYHDHRIVSDRTIDSHVKKLRRKIADVRPELEIIHSVYGVGYKFEPAGDIEA